MIAGRVAKPAKYHHGQPGFRTGRYVGGHVLFERGVATLMLGDLFVIDPGNGPVGGRVEVGLSWGRSMLGILLR